ncbi:hypothetical protein ALP64_202679 [Pseudomonas syringae pv. actinidiae]|nr:hypothetical protein ALP64_202679 [Pseudomonas syringae pv. actinidiae]BBI46963.1 hypothetical protein KPSA1B_105746 [Pseudomonas syringae pv. actinidiae]
MSFIDYQVHRLVGWIFNSILVLMIEVFSYQQRQNLFDILIAFS